MNQDAQKAVTRNIDEAAAFRAIVEGTSTGTGERFFSLLVENLAKALGVHGAWVTEFKPETLRLEAFAFWLGGDWVQNYAYAIKGTPCEPVIESGELFHVAENVIELYPNDPDLKRCGAVSYIGVPLKDLDGSILGHLAVLDNRPMPEDHRIIDLFRIFAARATAEMQRLRAEREIREREEKRGRLVNGAMDGIIELNGRLEVSLINPAAETMLDLKSADVVGNSITEYLSDASCEKLDQVVDELGSGLKNSSWIPDGLIAIRSNGILLHTEATISRAHSFYILILRDVNDRLQAERKIEALTDENERLEQELSQLRDHDEVLGKSKPIKLALQLVEQVAKTDATVLLLGETGTGKELFARAIHLASSRSRKQLIKVNCAAVPANLMESEFFGHEKGAFTGATVRREGRFALADGGTIFLDEVGELPIDLQSKLLRVLQEGEFESVGSGVTKKVNVRIVAATNRDLQAEIKNGNFRGDLYFRLNVFPIDIPALRERGNDVVIIAKRIVKILCQKMGRVDVTISEAAAARLSAYEWPGNVRELQNVLERALITSRPGHLDLERAMPVEFSPVAQPSPEGLSIQEDSVLNVDQFQDLERANLLRALDKRAWKVSGEQGAAALLGLKPSTLSSRMKALGITRPH